MSSFHDLASLLQDRLGLGPAFILGVALYTTSSILYRLYVHPLSAFPGPSLAGATGWYETYHEVYRRGKMIEELESLHARYGPVVRMGPNKLHFSDVAAYDAIYTNKDFRKTAQFYNAFVASEASFGTTDHRVSKTRRDLLRSFFSRKGVLKLENVIQDTIDRLIVSLSTKVGSPKLLNLQNLFSCITIEVITAYCFAKHYEAVTYPDYAYPVITAMQHSTRMACIAQHFPFILDIILVLPEWLIKLISPRGFAFADIRRALKDHINRILEDPSTLERAEHETIYHHMLNPKSGHKVPSEKSLTEEASVLVGAGTETTANACVHAIYHVQTNPQVHQRLKAELLEAWPDIDSPMPLERLEKLPYLSAVTHEALRFSHGITAALPRAVPYTTDIAGVVVPKGTIVHMGQTFVHRNPDIFPDPLTFRPERWLEKGASDLKNYLVPFSKGPRMCLGVNLAWAELFLILGNVYRKVDLEIVDTTPEDLSDFEAYLVPILSGIVKARVNKVEGVDHLVCEGWVSWRK